MSKLFLRQIYKLTLLVLAGFYFHGQTLAAGVCTASYGLPKTINLTNVQVESNLPAGATIPGSVQLFSAAGTCPIGGGGTVKVQVGSSIVACNYSNVTELMPGVYSTNVSGIGVRVRDANGNPLLNAVGVYCQQPIATVGVGGAYSFSGTWELVRTNQPLGSGGTLSTNDGKWVFGVYLTGLVMNGGVNASAIYPAGNITVRSLACVTTYPTTVNLDAIPMTALPSIGSAVSPKHFTIGTTCSNNARIGLTLDAAPAGTVLDEASGILSTQPGAGMATGVALQIIDGNSGSAVPMRKRIEGGQMPANVQTNFNFKAQYKRIGSVAAGNVVGGMVFIFDYQ